jgi:H/ACA ribonucleoprotein complex subunit 4
MKKEIENIKPEKPINELLNFGIINLNKASGPTSFKFTEYVKKSLGLKKTSHFGTLDPKVTGVLPIALSRACKLTGFFLGEDKEYVGIVRFHKETEKEKIQKKINEKFLGIIKQTPPLKSRVKRQEREREIKKFEILETSENKKDFLFRVECQGGTYVRTLCVDLGEELGIGGHMLELRRVRAGIFKENTSFNLYDFDKAVQEYKQGNEEKLREMIIPGKIIQEAYPVVKLKKDLEKKLFTGKQIKNEDILKKPGLTPGNVFCGFIGDKFIGMYERIKSSKNYGKPLFVLQPMD